MNRGTMRPPGLVAGHVGAGTVADSAPAGPNAARREQPRIRTVRAALANARTGSKGRLRGARDASELWAGEGRVGVEAGEASATGRQPGGGLAWRRAMSPLRSYGPWRGVPADRTARSPAAAPTRVWRPVRPCGIFRGRRSPWMAA